MSKQLIEAATVVKDTISLIKNVFNLCQPEEKNWQFFV